MTYIKMDNDMSLLITSASPIYRGENMSKSITFLLPKEIENVNFETASVFLSYIRADGEPDMVILEKLDELYSSKYLQYVIPVTCKITRYAGTVCMWLQFVDDSSSSTIVAKSGECSLRIHESKNMDDYLCDHQLMAIYQLKKQVESGTGFGNGDTEWEGMGDSGTSSDGDSDSTTDDSNSGNAGDSSGPVEVEPEWEDM